jgi:hypothetical protein
MVPQKIWNQYYDQVLQKREKNGVASTADENGKKGDEL